MKVFLIILAVLVLLVVLILSLTATITVTHDKGWHTKVKVLFFEKEIVLSEILSFVLFPEKKAQEVTESNAARKAEKKAEKKPEPKPGPEPEIIAEAEPVADAAMVQKAENKTASPEKKKSNPIMKIWEEEGIVGILSLLTNVIETANSAILTLFRGLHIYSLYVMIIVGGGDADIIARRYGTVCKYYYPLKGIILNGMKVDNYDDYVQPDFIAEHTEFEMQFIAGISVGLLVRMLLNAGFVFVKNLINNKKGDK